MARAVIDLRGTVEACAVVEIETPIAQPMETRFRRGPDHPIPPRDIVTAFLGRSRNEEASAPTGS